MAGRNVLIMTQNGKYENRKEKGTIKTIPNDSQTTKSKRVMERKSKSIGQKKTAEIAKPKATMARCKGLQNLHWCSLNSKINKILDSASSS